MEKVKKKNNADKTKAVKKSAVKSKKTEEQIKVFIDDLNKLVDLDDSLKYLKGRVEKLDKSSDYKTIAQFFRIIALSLQSSLDKVKDSSSKKDKEYAGRLEEKNKTLKTELEGKEESVKKLNKEIEDFKAEYVELRGKITRTGQEMQENMKKKLFLILLSVMDNFTLAVKSKDSTDDIQKVCDGFVMIHDQLKKVLETEGLKSVSYLGQIFDPKHQEIVQQVEDTSVESGRITEEIRQAYFYKDKLIRPAMVKVAK
ncbi:MAG: nucleotide exchange factor GrpE [Armatimonadota bacterium]